MTVLISVAFLAGCPLDGGITGLVSDAGEDQTVEPGAGVVLIGGPGTLETDGGGFSAEWTQIGGPVVEILLPFSPIAAFLAPEKEATLTFRLTIQDVRGRTGSDTVVIRVVSSGDEGVPAIISAAGDP